MGRLENQLGKGTIRPSLCIFKPTNIYLIKIKKRHAKKKVWNKFKVNYSNARTTSLLTLNIFYTFS